MGHAFRRTAIAGCLGGLLMISGAWAQTAQEHTAHHPDAAGAASSTPAAPYTGSTSGSDMAQMPSPQGMPPAGGMSRGGRSDSDAMMPMMGQMMRQGGM